MTTNTIRFGTSTLAAGLMLASGAVRAQNNGPIYSSSPATVSSQRIVAGTAVKATLLNGVDSSTAQVGTLLRAQVAAGDPSGLPSGTVFVGRVTRVHPATAKYPGVVDVSFGVAGRNSDGQPTSTVSFRDAASLHLTGKTASGDKSKYTTIGAGAGALIGLARKGKLGDAATGAILGGAGGYAANQAQKHAAGDVTLKSGDAVTLHMDTPLTLRTEIVSPY